MRLEWFSWMRRLRPLRLVAEPATNNGTSAGPSIFQQKLIKQLESKGKPVPKGLREAVVTLPAPPVLIERFKSTVAEWCITPLEHYTLLLRIEPLRTLGALAHCLPGRDIVL